MPINTAGLTAMADGFKTAFPYLAIHSGTDETASTGQTSSARVAAGWTVDANGDLTATNKAFTGSAGAAAQRVGYWSAASGGTFGGSQTLAGDQTFNAAGEYTLVSVTEDGSAT